MKEQRTYYLGQIVILAGNIVLLAVILFPWKDESTWQTVKMSCIASVLSIIVLTIVNYLLIEREQKERVQKEKTREVEKQTTFERSEI